MTFDQVFKTESTIGPNSLQQKKQRDKPWLTFFPLTPFLRGLQQGLGHKKAIDKTEEQCTRK